MRKITVIGNLGRDPELRYTNNNKAVLSMSIASKERVYNPALGKSEEKTEWTKVIVWGDQAVLCSQHLTKGRQVYVEGTPEVETYVDRDNVVRYTLKVTATAPVQFLGGKDDSAKPQAEAAARTPRAERAAAFVASGTAPVNGHSANGYVEPPAGEISEADIPF